MANDRPKRPATWVTIAGGVLGVLLAILLFVLGRNEYLFPAWGRYVAAGAGVACGLALRLIRRRSGHEIACAVFALFLYNLHMSLGGYTYLGWWAVPCFPTLAAAVYVAFPRRDRWWRVLAALNAAGFVGLVLLMFYRQYDFRNEAAACADEARRLPPAVKAIDSPYHPYDFGGLPGDRRLGVGFGQLHRFLVLDTETMRLVDGGPAPRGIQRVTPFPDARWFALPPWGQWGENERLVVADMDTGRAVTHIPVPGCRNLFDAEFAGDRLYALCEVSHTLHELSAAPPFAPLRTLRLPAMDAYDFALDRARRRAYVTDWFSPYLLEVDLDAMQVARRKWIGFSSFGAAIGPDGLVYVAQMFLRRVQAIEPSSLEIVRTIRAGYGPRDLDFDPERRLLLIGNYYDGTVDVVSLADGRRLNRVFVGTLLRGLWFDPGRDRLYVAAGCGVNWLPGSALRGG
jgi:hypothetical protein